MIKLLFPGFLAMALIHGGPASHAVAANDPAGRISCVTRGDSVVIDFGISKRPTNFAVITPGDEFLYIVYPKLGIDNMAQHPDRTGKVSLPISTQQGTRLGSKEDEQVRVFGSAGHYKLIFQDANTTEFEAPHSFQCSVRLSALTDPDHMAKAQAKNNETDKARRDSQGTRVSPRRVAPFG